MLLIAKKTDTDRDHIPDFWEISHGLDHEDPVSNLDALLNCLQGKTVQKAWFSPGNDIDRDGLSNDFEQSIGSLPDLADTDEDGLSDAEELQKGTHPAMSDTDGDGISDALDTTPSQHKKIPPSLHNPQIDSDRDGIPDLLESFIGLQLNTKETSIFSAFDNKEWEIGSIRILDDSYDITLDLSALYWTSWAIQMMEEK